MARIEARIDQKIEFVSQEPLRHSADQNPNATPLLWLRLYVPVGKISDAMVKRIRAFAPPSGRA